MRVVILGAEGLLVDLLQRELLRRQVADIVPAQERLALDFDAGNRAMRKLIAALEAKQMVEVEPMPIQRRRSKGDRKGRKADRWR